MTQVLMADGTSKAIGEVHDGDVVMATDPQTGETRPETVTATITTPDDKDFTDLTLTDDANPRGPPAADQAKITSTYHHPYWSDTRQQWVDAGELAPGEHLRQPDGTTRTVNSVRNYPYSVTTHNLTVSQLHTYYVLAGAESVLVNTCPEGSLSRREVPVSQMNKAELQAAVDTAAEHGYTLPQLGRGRGGADGSHGGFRLWGGGEDSMPLCHPEPALKSK